jgi:hypothetical protein
MIYFKEMSKDGFIISIDAEEAMYLESTGKYNKSTNGDIAIYLLR